MAPPPALDLGHYTPAELRAAGVGGIGFLQPLLARPVGEDGGEEEREAAEGLVRRGLLAQADPPGQALGALAATLDAIAAAWAFTACTAGAGPGGPERLLFGRLGETDLVLDLLPEVADEAAGYTARLLSITGAIEEVAASLDLGDGDGDAAAATVEGTPGWPRIETAVAGAPVERRIEAASIGRPQGPLLQQRLQLVSADGATWMVLGARRGPEAAWRSAAPAGPRRARSAIRAMLAGDPVRL
jgi:hypothetical protein